MAQASGSIAPATARWLPTGVLEFLGRFDDQVKIRGFRVEPGDIESHLADHPDLRETAVVAAADGQRLVAYVTASNGRMPADSELRQFLKGRLPEYMIPAAFVPLPTIPRTPGGKVDRRALPTPNSVPQERQYTAPRTATEQAIARIWQQVLDVERVGIDDGFFDLGGHSLLAMQIVARIRDQLGVELPLRLVFDEPTVANLAARVDATASNARQSTIPTVPRDGPMPLSFAQERLWFLDQLESGSAFYNIAGAIHLHGPIDPDTLRRALCELVRRHETLRTTFDSHDDRPVQFIAADVDIPLPLTDLCRRPNAECESEQRRIAEAEARQPFDLQVGPLLRLRLLRIAEDDHILLTTMHHIISDGWSIEVLVREAMALYEAFVHHQPSPLPPLPVQYADYAQWQRDAAHHDERESQTRLLEGATPRVAGSRSPNRSAAPGRAIVPRGFTRIRDARRSGNCASPIWPTAKMSRHTRSYLRRFNRCCTDIRGRTILRSAHRSRAATESNSKD